MACALASCDARARAMWSRARCVGNTGLPGVLGVRGGCADLPGVLGVLVAALAMSVLPAGNAAPVVPCGAALAAPGATVGGDVSKCLLNTSSVLAGEQASTAWQVAQVDAALTDIDAVVGTFSSELDVVLKAVLAAQTKLDAQASAVACLNDCIVMGSCTCVGDITAGSGPASPGPAPTGSSMTSVGF